jgi:phosphoglycolate phosphatase-like HAD superfamily hydrolase
LSAVPARSPNILALDFDGVLCDGRPEYFESSCRACRRVWPEAEFDAEPIRDPFYRLRPVIMSGWEMPVLVRAVAAGVDERRVLRAWPEVREAIVAEAGPDRDRLVQSLRSSLDDVRREWIAEDPDGWLRSHMPYADLDAVRRLSAEPRHTAIVTTKEGEFARRILAHWQIDIADVQGKEAGEHKCTNLAELIERHGETSGTSTLWFVEDRLETLTCVIGCSERDPRLTGVRLFLAAWGYTTPADRAAARRNPRIRLLSLSRFARGFAHWPAG